MTDQNDDHAWDINEARRKFRPVVDSSKKGRKARQKVISDSTDGRSLRATGRSEHLNFKATPRIKQALAKHVGRGRQSLWIEEAILAKFEAEGINIDE